MDTKGLSRCYGQLTPDQRFCLILAAGARGDDTEQARVIKAGTSVTFSTKDHIPFSRAITEMSQSVYLDLLEEAWRYLDALHRANTSDESSPDEDSEGSLSLGERYFQLALAAGFALRTKAEGWKLFCQRRNLPPFVLWEDLLCFDRLQDALKMCERAAYTAEGFLSWLNEVGDNAGQPELSDVPFTVESTAAAMPRGGPSVIRDSGYTDDDHQMLRSWFCQ